MSTVACPDCGLQCGRCHADGFKNCQCCFDGIDPACESAIEQRTVEAIAAWLECNAGDPSEVLSVVRAIRLADAIRSGAWKEKP